MPQEEEATDNVNRVEHTVGALTSAIDDEECHIEEVVEDEDLDEVVYCFVVRVIWWFVFCLTVVGKRKSKLEQESYSLELAQCLFYNEIS